MIIGDSGMVDASPAIEALYQRLGATTVVNVAFPGFGLTNATGWRSSFPGLVAANRPQVILAMLGGWDRTYIQSHGADAYLAVLDDATKVLTSGGGRILWLGMPPPAKPVGVESTVDPLLQMSATRHPGIAAYADPGLVLRVFDGSAPRWLPDGSGRLVLARKPDGWHFCPEGAVVLAQFVGTAVARLGWTPVPLSGWETGTWRSDHHYDDPPGGCDTTLPQNAPPPSNRP